MFKAGAGQTNYQSLLIYVLTIKYLLETREQELTLISNEKPFIIELHWIKLRCSSSTVRPCYYQVKCPVDSDSVTKTVPAFLLIFNQRPTTVS